MGWVETLSIIGMWGIFILSICDFIIVIIANHHPKYSKNKILHEKLFLPVGISFVLWGIFALLWGLPIFYTNEVPINIKIGLIILALGSIGFAAWACKYKYHKYKDLVKKSLKSPVESVEK